MAAILKATVLDQSQIFSMGRWSCSISHNTWSWAQSWRCHSAVIWAGFWNLQHIRITFNPLSLLQFHLQLPMMNNKSFQLSVLITFEPQEILNIWVQQSISETILLVFDMIHYQLLIGRVWLWSNMATFKMAAVFWTFRFFFCLWNKSVLILLTHPLVSVLQILSGILQLGNVSFSSSSSESQSCSLDKQSEGIEYSFYCVLNYKILMDLQD